MAIYQTEGGNQLQLTHADNASAAAAVDQYNGLKTLDDYVKLYDGQWEQSTFPSGVSPGLLTNYTNDLLFSMERLSFNPYAVRRLSPEEDVPFLIDDEIVRNVSGQSLTELHSSSRLFYIDHRGQDKLTRATDGKYSAACDALFYISEASGNFLPLSIRTMNPHNDGLVYTPRDSPEDWLLAKMMFNSADFFMAQFHHLANTHYVAEVLFQAAIRTLSDNHPVLALLSRIMYGAFGIRPAAVANLFDPGAAVDRYFGYTGTSAAQYAAELYTSGFAGSIQSNYFLANLRKRGLIDSPSGPALPHLPFHEDALPLYTATQTFLAAFVGSYYPDPFTITADFELQAWLVEAKGAAQAIEVPEISTPVDLVHLLTHIAHLSTSAHHAVNLNQLITSGGVLPFHPTAMYKPVPVQKGVTDIASYLPPLAKCLGMLAVEANFARPLLVDSNRSMVHMFDDEGMLTRMNRVTRDANAVFMADLQARSREVRAREFDQDGLAQGMPFLWKALDPETIPWSLSI